MSKPYVPVAPGRARTRLRRGSAALSGRDTRTMARSAAGDAAQSASLRAGVGPAGTTALLSLAVVLLCAVMLLLRAGAVHVSALGVGAADSSGRQRATQTIDSRLLLEPRTVTQAATVSAVRVELSTGPLLPGSNRFELRLAGHGRPLAGARVVLAASMIGMAMRPVTLPMSEVRPGRYAATGPLTMFGRWRITVRITRPGIAPLRRQFTVGVDLPRGLLTAPATQGGAH